MSKKSKSSIFIIIIAVILGVGTGWVINSISSRKTEARFAYAPTEKIKEHEVDSEKWKANYPAEYQSYIATKSMDFKSKYNGNVMIDMLKVDPRLVVLWAGYGFSKDYNQARGHYYSIVDLQNSLRTGGPLKKGTGPMPSTCWTCKGPDVPRLMDKLGVAEFYKGKWFDKGHEVTHAIGCADCHDPSNMQLRITRPALKEGFAMMGKDIEKVSHNEMRSLVCAQCHVEYYFDKKKEGAEGVPYLTFPWAKGFSVENMEAYYDEAGFKDWTHKISKAPMLKAQHPGYETFQMGIHGQRGVSCADCHMPYKTQGGQKFTDHHVQSPLNNVANSCQVCHREEAKQLISDVYEREDKIIEQRDELEKLLVRAHVEAGKAWELGATEEQMHDILQDIRHSQWRWDYAAAAHGAAFHAPIEIARVISSGIHKAQDARLKLVKLFHVLGFDGDVPYPNIETKADAQKFIGLPVEKLQEEKNKFLDTIVPTWMGKAKAKDDATAAIK